MTYVQQTINNVDAANFLMGLIDTALIAEGYTVFYNNTPSGDYRVRVYKSAAATNQAGIDWYLCFRWDTTGTESYFNVFAGETFTAATNTLGRATVGNNASASRYGVNPDGGLWGDIIVNTAPTQTLSTTIPGTGTVTQTIGEIVPSSAFGVWISVTPDHFVLFGTGPVINREFFTIAKNANYLTYFDGGSGTPIVGKIGAGTVYVPSSVWKGPVATSSVNGRFVQIGGRSNYNLRSSVLPALTGPNDLVAKAYRPRIFASVTGYTGNGGTWVGPTPPDSGLEIYGSGATTTARSTLNLTGNNVGDFGGPVRIGDAIDVLEVRGGSLGDTFTIAGATYVISQPNGTAVLVQ